MAGAASIMAGMAFVKITMDNAELKRGLDDAQGRVQKFASAVNSFSSKMVMLGPLIAAPFVAATRAFAAFDDQMRLTGAVTGATGKQLEKLTEQAKKLGRETSFTAAQVASGMAALGKMGFNPQEIENAIQPMMNLARATGTDLSEAAQITANAMRAMNISTDKTADVVDILTATANGSAQGLTDLGEALKMAAPAARTAGETITDVNAALGVLANVGIRGSMAGNALKRAYSELAKSDVQEYLKRFNIDVKDSNGNLRRMADVLRDCAAQMANMGSADKINFATQVFGERAAPAVLSMTADTSKIDEMLKKLQNCKGAAAATAAEMDKGLGGAMRRLASAAEGISIAIGEIVSTSFSPVIEAVSAFCLSIREAIGAGKELTAGIMGFIGTVVSAGAVIKVFAIVASMIKSLFAPLAVLDNLVSGSTAKAAAAAAAEKERAVATEARVARQIAAEKLKTANDLAEAAKQKVAIAENATAELQALKGKKYANDIAIAESARVIAAKQAETAAIIAEEEKIIAAQEGRRGGGAARAIKTAQAKIQAAQNEAAATITAETEKQAAIRKTNLALTAQISAHQKIAIEAGKGAKYATAAATAAKNDYQVCAQAATAATAAETRLTAAKEIANKKDLARGALLAKTVTMQKFRIAYTQREAAVIMATSMKSMVAAKVGVGASKLRTAGYYMEAAGAKVAAGATMALGAALNFIAANPITFVFLALAAAIAVVSHVVNESEEAFKREADAAKEAAEAVSELREKGDQKRVNDMADYKRLVQLEELANQGRITNEEMQEAEKIATALQSAYGNLGIVVDTVSKSISGAATAQEKFNEAMRRAAILQLEAEIDKQQIVIDKLHDRLAGATRAFWSAAIGKDTNTEEYTTALFQIDSVAKHDAPIKKQIAAEYKLLNAQRERLRALKAGDQSAVTGKKDEPTSADRFRQTVEAQRAAAKELADAEKELARIDEENAKKKMSQLEQEIYEIGKVKEKYLELAKLKRDDLQAELRAAQKKMEMNAAGDTPAQKAAYEQAKKAAEEAQAQLDTLDKRIEAARKSFADQEAEARKKDEDRRKKAEAKYTGFLQDTEQKQQARAAEKAQDKQFSDLQKDKSPAGVQALSAFMDALSSNLEAAKEEYRRQLEQAQSADSEGGSTISEAERAQLDAMQNEINASIAKLNSYRDQIAGGIQTAQQKTQTLASFDASTLQNLFDRSGRAAETREERIAKATEETAKNTKKLTQGGGLLVG